MAAGLAGPSAGSPPARTCTARKASRAKKAASDPAKTPNEDGLRRGSVVVAATAPPAATPVAAVVVVAAVVAGVVVPAVVVEALDGPVVLGVVAPAAAVAAASRARPPWSSGVATGAGAALRPEEEPPLGDELGLALALGDELARARRRTVWRTTSVRTSGVAAAGWGEDCGSGDPEPPDARATVASMPRATTVTPAAI